MDIKERIDIVMEGNQAVARHRNEDVGHITVPEVDFQWCEDTFIRMGGIGGVGTDEEFRGRGIAGRMMERAVAYSNSKGYACGGVSTGTGNIARRLYSRAGYEYVFSMGYLTRDPRSLVGTPPPGTHIRGYEEKDAQGIVRLREREYGRFFGSRRPDPSRWLAARQETLRDDPQSVLLAVQDGEAIGYASYFQHWFDLACDLCVAECRDRLEVGRGLLRALESGLVARGCESAAFSLTEDEPFIRELLAAEGYRSGYSRVFNVNILRLDALLRELEPSFVHRARASDLPGWTGTLEIKTEEDHGAAEIGEEPDRCLLVLSTSEPTLTHVLCGRMSGWEAYLRGLLSVSPSMDAQVVALLQILLPKVPCCHPIDEWW